jgi:hypothetical protein
MSDTVTIERPPAPVWAGSFQSIEKVGDPKSIFLYGTHGTRKTSIASSIYKVPGINRVLHIDIDQGAETLATDPIIKAAIKDGSYNVLPINSLASNAKANLERVISDVTTVDYGYDAVIFDTLDVAQDVAEAVFEEKYATTGKGGKRDGFAVYREIGAWTDKYVRSLHNCPWLVGVVTAHEKENTDDEGTTRIQPRLSGSSKDAIGGIPSIVLRLAWQNHPETGARALITTMGEDEKLITKQRYRDLLPRQMRDITLPDLYSRIRGEYTEPTAATAETN